MTDNTRSAALMVVAMLAFVVNDTFMKLVGDEIPLFQAIFLRGLGVSAVFLVLAWRMGVLRLPDSRRDRRLVALRTLGEVGAAGFFLNALFNMPLANATAILQSLPLAITLASALVLGEKVGVRRWSAVAVGFLGVLLIVRPGAEGFTIHSLSALAAVACVTLRDLSTRQLDASVPSLSVAVLAGISAPIVFGSVSLLPGVGGVWVMPSAAAFGALAGAMLALVAGYLLSVMMMRLGEVSLIAPFRYTSLLWALLLGVMVFGEWPDALTLAGAVLVVAAGSFTLWRSARKGATAALQPPADPSR